MGTVGTLEPAGDVPTIGEHLRAWLETRRDDLTPATWGDYHRVIERQIIPRIGDAPLHELESRHLERLYEDLLSSGGARGQVLSPRSVRFAYTILRGALDHAERLGLVDRNVADEVEPPKAPRQAADTSSGALQVWSEGELRRFLQYAAGHPLRWLYRTAAATGAASSELLALDWGDVDLDGSTVRFHRSLSVVGGVPERCPPKNTPRTVHIDAGTVDGLHAHRDQQSADRRTAGADWSDTWDLVFTTDDGRQLDGQAINRPLTAITRAAGLPTISFSDLRHTHAVLLLRCGVPIATVSARLGHRNVRTTEQRYAESPELDRAAASRCGELMGVGALEAVALP